MIDVMECELDRSERIRATMRRCYHLRRKRGQCAKCDRRARRGKSTCATCGRRESIRRNEYERRKHGQQPRYENGRGYGPRLYLTPPIVRVAPKDCPRCHGCLDGGVRCINCGNVILLAMPAEKTRAYATRPL